MTNKFLRQREVLVYENRFVQLFDDEVLTPAGVPGRYIRFRYQENPPGVVIVPVTAEGNFLLIEVYRYAFDANSLEFPRGTAHPGETAESAAVRELHEETGVTALECQFIGYTRPDTSIVETEVSMFVLKIGPGDGLRTIPDASGECIQTCILYSPQQLLHAIESGEVRDGYSIAAVGMLAARRML